MRLMQSYKLLKIKIKKKKKGKSGENEERQPLQIS